MSHLQQQPKTDAYSRVKVRALCVRADPGQLLI